MGPTMLEYLDSTGGVEGSKRSRHAFRALAFELATCGAIDYKEFFESVEFYERVRKRVRRPVMIEMACGHGLAGVSLTDILHEHNASLVQAFRDAEEDTRQGLIMVCIWAQTR